MSEKKHIMRTSNGPTPALRGEGATVWCSEPTMARFRWKGTVVKLEDVPGAPDHYHGTQPLVRYRDGGQVLHSWSELSATDPGMQWTWDNKMTRRKEEARRQAKVYLEYGCYCIACLRAVEPGSFERWDGYCAEHAPGVIDLDGLDHFEPEA